MSRWIIIAGLATLLISLVGLATLAGSNQNATEGASQVQESAEPDPSEVPDPAPDEPAPDEPAPDEPAPDEPAPDEPAPDEPAPDTTTPATTEQEQGAAPEEPDEGGGLLQGDRPGGQGGTGIGPRVATIEITGDSRYSCSIGQINSPRTVRGSNPAPFQVRVAPGGRSLDAVMAVCQKISGEELGVTIVYDGEARAQDSTTEQFGTVSASWSPIQQ